MISIESVLFAGVVLFAFVGGMTLGIVLGWRSAIWRLMTENADQFATISEKGGEGK